jgi:hypothetical protein
MSPRKWARAKQSGAHGLRRGAWYLVVNVPSKALVVLSVRKHNVPVPRSVVELSDEPPTKWSVVRWEESQSGARRVSEQAHGLTYGVCPECGARGPLVPPDAQTLTCDECGKTAEVDWENPC